MWNPHRYEPSIELLDHIRIPKRHRSCLLELVTDQVVDGQPAGPRTQVSRYIGGLERTLPTGVGLWMQGPNGAGKTAAACLVGIEAACHGMSCLFMEWATAKSDVIQRERFSEEMTLWDRAKTVDVLIVDDLFKGVQDRTGFADSLFDELIRARNADMLVTVVTTNATKEETVKMLRPSTMSLFKEHFWRVVFADGLDRRDNGSNAIASIMEARDA